MTTRAEIIKQAQAWVGLNEKAGTHKIIIDTYNSHKPLARGYTAKYSDEWCAIFITALAVKCGATDIIPKECSCTKMIELAKAKGIWVETDNYKASPADLILYDWQDNSGTKDNVGAVEHIGIIEKVEGNTFTVIEGNKGEAVARRTVAVDGKYIRGFIVPKYATNRVVVELTELRKGATGNEVKTVQRLLLALGFKMRNGLTTYGVDGSFGTATENAVKNFQNAKGLMQDGIVGTNTWAALLWG